MDRATDHLVTVPPADESAARESASNPDEQLDLALRKQRLIDAARAIDPFSPLRRHPFVTVATAAAIGVVAASPAAARTVGKIIPPASSAKKIGELATKFAAGFLAGKGGRDDGAHAMQEACAEQK